MKAKTCMRRDKTFLRAPVGACKTMGNGLAPSWPNKWRWRWVARRGVEGGGPAQKGVRAAFMHAASSYLVQ